jgi:hypothetical protein
MEAEEGHGNLFGLGVKLPEIGSATTENSSEFDGRISDNAHIIELRLLQPDSMFVRGACVWCGALVNSSATGEKT